jgi:hypothetical protein
MEKKSSATLLFFERFAGQVVGRVVLGRQRHAFLTLTATRWKQGICKADSEKSRPLARNSRKLKPIETSVVQKMFKINLTLWGPFERLGPHTEYKG